jgi:hypothetical protein
MKKEFEIGDKILMKYGFNMVEFFIFDKKNNNYLLGKKGWLNTSTIQVSFKYVNYKKAIYICKGKFNIFSKIPWIGDLICKYK